MTKFLCFLWLMLRSKTTREKLFTNFAAWRLLLRKFKKQQPANKTVVTYLPPINAPVTSFSTIYQYLTYMQKLYRESNMPFVNVTLDCGAAVNAFKLVWNYHALFHNVVIHLGDFHFMKEIFSILGLLINVAQPLQNDKNRQKYAFPDFCTNLVRACRKKPLNI